MKTIPLSNGQKALVDDDDYPRLAQYHWYIHGKYAERWVPKVGGLSMHRDVMNPPAHLVVDHLNFNTLDNRKSNLRVCTNSENVSRRNPLLTVKPNNGFHGIRYVKKDRQWQVRFRKNKQQIYVGEFKDAVTAAIAYDLWAKDEPHQPLNFGPVR